MPARHLGALGAVILLGAALRFPTLDVQSFWLDEAVTVGLLRMELDDMLSAIPDSESTPPLYYVLSWAWAKLAGTGEVGLRSLSALAGTLTVPVAYAAASRLASPRAGLGAAAVCAVNPLLVWYSQEARAYALLVLLTALSFLFFVAGLRGGGRRALGGWALVSALALATHYFALFLIAAEAVWLIAAPRAREAPHRRDATVAAVGVAAVGAALLPLAVHQSRDQRADFISESDLGTRLAQVPKQLLVGFDLPAEALVTALAAVLAAAALALLILRGGPGERSAARLAGGLAAAATAVPLALAVAGADYVITRNLLAGLVPLAVAAGACLAAHDGRRAGAVLGAALCGLSVVVVVAVSAEPRYQRDNWRGAAEALGPASGPRAVVVTPGSGRVPLAVYLPAVSELRPEGASFTQVALVGLGVRGLGERLEPPRPATVDPPAAGFRLTARTDTETFTAVAFRAPGPVPLFPPGLASIRLGPEPAAVLAQPAAR